jgi:PDZ domain-containing secreted protein
MKLERRVPLPWLIVGAVVACVWCSFLSGLGGWVMGRDLTSRADRAQFATETAARSDLQPLGVLVVRLDRAGPAARAGIARNDLIVAVEGTPVEDARDLRDQLRAFHAGDMVRLTLLRDQGQQVDVPVQLAPFPGDGRRAYLGIYYTARVDEPGDV